MKQTDKDVLLFGTPQDQVLYGFISINSPKFHCFLVAFDRFEIGRWFKQLRFNLKGGVQSLTLANVLCGRQHGWKHTFFVFQSYGYNQTDTQALVAVGHWIPRQVCWTESGNFHSTQEICSTFHYVVYHRVSLILELGKPFTNPSWRREQ